MQRRRFLQLTGVSGTVALAGCIGDDSTDAPGTSTDTGTEAGTQTGDAVDGNSLIAPIERLWGAYNERDIDGMQAVFHPDSSAQPTEEGISFQAEVTVSSTTVVERGEESATVEAALVFETDTDRSERTETYELRRYEGRWVIWSQGVRGGDAADGPLPPQVAFETAYDSAATDGSDTGVLTITHSGGDNVEAARLSIVGSGIVALDGVDTDVTASDTNWGEATGVADVNAGTSITVGVRSDCQVSVVWTAPDGDTSSALTEYEGPDV